MTTPNELTLADLESLHEGIDLEVKKAGGRDGRGAVPNDVWSTYVAMANTRGGRIVLGVRERQDHSLQVTGLEDVERVRRDFWNTVNNPAKVSANILGPDDVTVATIDAHTVLVIDVPRASRGVRPLFINGDPFKVYLRQHEGDVLVRDHNRVRRMIADAQQDTRDTRIIEHFGVDDVDASSFKAYRQRFRDMSPDHPWLALDDAGLLTKLGAIRRDRATDQEGLTLAGLLAFGSEDALRENLPGHMLDYQERQSLSSQDWLDRVYPDGTWSGNLFDFYRKVMPKLTSGLKVPFQLGGDLFRKSETHVHEAIREALVNSLVHADHESSNTIVVLRAPEGLVFENPGLPRLPREQMLQGGVSDCRNKTLQKIFLRVGLGEQAGSGYSRILRAWHEQHWSHPKLQEQVELARTRLQLPLVSLFPEQVQQELSRSVPNYEQRDEIDRLILVVAATEGRVTNTGMQERCTEHSRDLTSRLKALVEEGVLTPHGERKGRSYTLAEHFAGTSNPHSSGTSGDSSGTLNKEDLNDTSWDSPGTPDPNSSGTSDPHSSGTSDPHSSGTFLDEDTEEVLQRIRATGWIARPVAQQAVLRLCRDRWVTLDQFAEALHRAPDTVQRSYVTPLVKSGQLERRHSKPNHPQQAYRARRTPPEDPTP